MYKKITKMESFMVVKSFTLQNYFINGKEKREVEKKILMAPSQSCFVTVSVLVGISAGVPLVEGSRIGSEYVQCPLTPLQSKRLFP